MIELAAMTKDTIEETKRSKKRSSKVTRTPLIWLVLTLRWSIVAGFFVFVARGWHGSARKYTAKKTSVGIVMNESTSFTYPSVTFCPKFKGGVGMADTILNEDSTGDDWLQRATDKWSWLKTDFLKVFAHSPDEGPYGGLTALHNASNWESSVPHPVESGRCFTYNPPFESSAGWWYGIRFGIKLPGSDGKTQEEKERMLEDMEIFIHKKGYFTFYKQDDFPNSMRLDLSLLRYRRATEVTLKARSFAALGKDGGGQRLCTDRPGVTFTKCVDIEYSKRRGCQAPWNYHNDSNIPWCSDLNFMKNWFKNVGIGQWDYDRIYETALHTSEDSGCPQPCTTLLYMPTYSYKQLAGWLGGVDQDSDWVVHIWFKNFFFSYETEFLVCDWTCLVGEMGGNLGFFLGGSLLASLDFLFGPTLDRLKNRK